jgi:hypothetical protein
MRTPSSYRSVINLLIPLTEVVDLIMNLISRTHNFYERREYIFNILPEYSIITRF